MQLGENVRVAVNGLLDHKIRSVLTMLGIIFGVAAVIAMLSIGEGAKEAALAKYKELGVNNIIVRERELDEEELEEVRAKFSKGLSLEDAYAINEIIPTVEAVAPQTEMEVDALYEDLSGWATIIAITPSFGKILNYNPRNGTFINDDHYNRSLKVCVLGAAIANTLFPFEDPVGKYIKLEDQWLQVIGVMPTKSLFAETVGELASREINNDVYIPLSTFNKRFSKENILASELNQITIKVKSSEQLFETAEIIDKLLNRRHFNNDDYEIIIPYELLKQEEKERRIYNILLGSIAAISLLVGGIGIMNIMLATVLERTREIGIRRAIGAKKQHIMNQFLTEATALSISGGLIGVFLGLFLSTIISLLTGVTTHVTVFSILIAFTVSVIIGISFGYLPAKNAANLNPIESIRYE